MHTLLWPLYHAAVDVTPLGSRRVSAQILVCGSESGCIGGEISLTSHLLGKSLVFLDWSQGETAWAAGQGSP